MIAALVALCATTSTQVQRPARGRDASAQPRAEVDPPPSTGTQGTPEGMKEILGPGNYDPDEGPFTVWAKAGARSASDCTSRAEQAREDLRRHGDRISTRASMWVERAQRCPNQPDILRMAAFSVLQRDVPLPPITDEALDLTSVDDTLVRTRRLALGWLDAAEAEAIRRGEPVGEGVDYFRALALSSVGQAAEAEKLARRALERGDAEPWRVYRLLALCEMMSGELTPALDHARRAWVFAPERERVLSGFVYAIVLDRAGDTAASRRVFRLFRDRGPTEARRVLELILPTHERLFFLALEEQLAGRGHAEPLRLWKAYLAREEPTEAERKLAKAHLSELGPAPEGV